MFLKTAGCCKWCRIVWVSSGLKGLTELGAAIACRTYTPMVGCNTEDVDKFSRQLMFKSWCYTASHWFTVFVPVSTSSNVSYLLWDKDCVDFFAAVFFFVCGCSHLLLPTATSVPYHFTNNLKKSTIVRHQHLEPGEHLGTRGNRRFLILIIVYATYIIRTWDRYCMYICMSLEVSF